MCEEEVLSRPSQVDLQKSESHNNPPKYPMHLIEIGDSLAEFAKKDGEKEFLASQRKNLRK